MEREELYFKTDKEWREWLHENHENENGIYLIFYKVDQKNKACDGKKL